MKRSFHPFRKKWGQNFLNDSNLLNKIVKIVNPSSSDIIFEIGAGDGALTEKFFPQVNNMFAVEIDPLLIKKLYQNKNLHGLTIIDGDVLNYNLDKLEIKDTVKIIGNIPYNITSSIIFWLIEQLDFWEEAYIMMQREVAQRLVADVGTKEYGRITVVTSAYLKKEISLNIPPEVFFPKPKVHSALVKFSKAKPQIISDDKFVKYNRMVKKAFSERRKMIRNTLSGYTFNDEVKNKIDFKRRPETLSPQEFAYLVKSTK